MRNYFKVGREIFIFEESKQNSIQTAFDQAVRYAQGDPALVCIWTPISAHGPWRGIDLVGIPQRGEPPRIGDYENDLEGYEEATARHIELCTRIDSAWADPRAYRQL